MTLTRKKMGISIVAAFLGAMLLALLPAVPASANHPGAAAAYGAATLNWGIGTCGSFSYSGGGAAVNLGGASATVGTASASGNYCNTDVIAGTAVGTLTVTGIVGPTVSCNFTWRRSGLVALVTFTGPGSCGGTAIAAFVPVATRAPGAGGPTTAAVVGLGIF